MINKICSYNYNPYATSFKSRPLADVELKKPDGKPVKACFSEFDINGEDKQAYREITRRWKDIASKIRLDEILNEFKYGKKIYAIELAEEGDLADRLLTLASINDPPFSLDVEQLLSSPASRHSLENPTQDRIKGGGTVMMAMLTKLAGQLGLDEISVSPTRNSRSFYEGLEMKPDYDKNFYCFQGSDMGKFINKVEREYEMGEINSEYIEEVKDSLL